MTLDDMVFYMGDTRYTRAVECAALIELNAADIRLSKRLLLKFTNDSIFFLFKTNKNIFNFCVLVAALGLVGIFFYFHMKKIK